MELSCHSTHVTQDVATCLAMHAYSCMLSMSKSFYDTVLSGTIYLIAIQFRRPRPAKSHLRKLKALSKALYCNPNNSLPQVPKHKWQFHPSIS